MEKTYPELKIWLSTLKKIQRVRKTNPSIPEPPIFLILAGWQEATGIVKQLRWEEIKAWANENKLNHLMPIENIEVHIK